MYYAWNSSPSQPVDQPNGKHLLLLRTLVHWHHWYRIRSNNCISQQQPTTSYRQTNKSLPGMNQPTIVKITTKRKYTWQFKYANTMPTFLCINTGFICGYIAGIHMSVNRRSIMSCVTWNMLQSIGILLYPDNFMIILVPPIIHNLAISL